VSEPAAAGRTAQDAAAAGLLELEEEPSDPALEAPDPVPEAPELAEPESADPAPEEDPDDAGAEAEEADRESVA
jgi:hypothetical protein